MREASAESVRLQAPVPEHAPPQPVSVRFAPGVAVSATVVPSANSALQAPRQLMPTGWEVTVPPPVTDTLSVCRTGVTTV